jgi:hypothetical protein
MGFEEFEGKMLGLVGVSGGTMGAFSALEGLRNIGRALHAWVVPEQASIRQAWQKFDEAGKLNWTNASGRWDDRWRALRICTAPARRMNSCRSGSSHSKIQAARNGRVTAEKSPDNSYGGHRFLPPTRVLFLNSQRSTLNHQLRPPSERNSKPSVVQLRIYP